MPPRQEGLRCPRLPAIVACAIAATLALSPELARSDTVDVLAGISTSGSAGHSYGWQLAFEKAISAQFGASASWINEGHFSENERDGAAAQFWWHVPSWREGVGLNLGLGPYVYFDTQPSTSIRGYHDLHGAGAVVSASLTARVRGPFYLQLRANEIMTDGNPGTVGVLLGVGYRFDGAPGRVPAAGTTAVGPGSTLELFGGQAITNTLSTRTYPILGLDYRLDVARWAAWSATWFDDPDAAPGLHDRAATQFWLRDSPVDSLTFSLGLGPYLQLGDEGSGASAPARVSGLSGLRVDWQWATRVSLIATWYRLFTQDDRDRDLITLGLGWRFGSR